jgi:hypothetical protein
MDENNQDNRDPEIPGVLSQKAETLRANMRSLYECFKNDPQALRSILQKAYESPENLLRLPEDLQRKRLPKDLRRKVEGLFAQSPIREHIERKPGHVEKVKNWLKSHLPQRNKGQGPKIS